MKRRIFIVCAAIVVIAAGVWILVNPGQRFGISTQAFTTYNRLSLPMVDLQVRGDGAMRLVSKSHKVDAEQLDSLTQVQVLTLRTGEALKKFNSLREQGVRVAIHVHSTC